MDDSVFIPNRSLRCLRLVDMCLNQQCACLVWFSVYKPPYYNKSPYYIK